jgi:hypothetical protein
MFARLTFVEAEPRQDIGGLLRVVEPMLPMIESMAGSRGVLWLGDTAGGRGIAITFFEDLDALNDSREAAAEVIPDLLQHAGARLRQVEEYEVLLSSRQVRIG